MNGHKNARLTYARRIQMVRDITERGLSVPQAAVAHGVSSPMVARKWLGRYLAQGLAGLADAPSRPQRSPAAIQPAKALAIVELRKKRLTQAPGSVQEHRGPGARAGRALAPERARSRSAREASCSRAHFLNQAHC